MSNFVYAAVSLDGFIARPDGDISWLDGLPTEGIGEFSFSVFMRSIGAVVMGRNTFEKVLGFGLPEWPYAKPVFVLSAALKTPPPDLAGKVEIVNGGIDAVLDRLNAGNYRDIYVDGGRTVQGFLRRDLIDEMILSTVPVILGGGIPLFGETGAERKFTVVKTEKLDDRIMAARYRRAR